MYISAYNYSSRNCFREMISYNEERVKNVETGLRYVLRSYCFSGTNSVNPIWVYMYKYARSCSQNPDIFNDQFMCMHVYNMSDNKGLTL